MKLTIKHPFLCLPVVSHPKDTRVLKLFDGEKLLLCVYFPFGEAAADNGTYSYEYLSPLPVSEWIGRTLTLSAEFPAGFEDAVTQTDELPVSSEVHPAVHFTANAGWINDPNGLVYDNGTYHLYYQHNPFGVNWNNMSWGHATSTDLLHWTRLPVAMLPDEEGTIFSGCGLTNEHRDEIQAAADSNLYRSLPKDALLFFYTAAGGSHDSACSEGKDYTQHTAYSTDHGLTLQKLPGAVVPFLKTDNRDPKVYWHEKSKAFIMSLYLKGTEYAILRSTDMLHWEITQQLTFETANECPDLRPISAPDGTEKWIFYTASSEYFIGDFDGFRFTNYSAGKRASYTELAYAGQTYNNAADRIVLIQWLRTQNPERLYTGMLTLPRELELIKQDGEWILAQHPVHEWFDAKKAANTLFHAADTTSCQAELTSPAAVGIDVSLGSTGKVSFSILGNICAYDAATGIFTCADKATQLPAGLTELHLIADRGILELSAKQDTVIAYWELPDDRTCGTITVNADTPICAEAWTVR